MWKELFDYFDSADLREEKIGPNWKVVLFHIKRIWLLILWLDFRSWLFLFALFATFLCFFFLWWLFDFFFFGAILFLIQAFKWHLRTLLYVLLWPIFIWIKVDPLEPSSTLGHILHNDEIIAPLCWVFDPELKSKILQFNLIELEYLINELLIHKNRLLVIQLHLLFVYVSHLFAALQLRAARWICSNRRGLGLKGAELFIKLQG